MNKRKAQVLTFSQQGIIENIAKFILSTQENSGVLTEMRITILYLDSYSDVNLNRQHNLLNVANLLRFQTFLKWPTNKLFVVHFVDVVPGQYTFCFLAKKS